MDPFSYQRIDQLLSQYGLDAILCRLPENVVYLTGTLPVHGNTLAFYLPGEQPILLQPDCELQWVREDLAEVHTYPWGHLGNPAPLESFRRWFKQLDERFGARIHTLGIELDFSVAAPAYSSAEALLPDATWRSAILDQFPSVQLVDACPALAAARAVKSPTMLALIKRANQIAGLGLSALGVEIHKGMTEVQAAALVESTIRVDGTGYEGASLVKAYAQVTGGALGTFRQSMLTPSGRRAFEEGDLVMIELAVCADGLWSDLTRVYCVGKPSEEQARIYNTVLQAQAAGAAMLKPGNPWGCADQAAREVITSAGYGKFFKHGTGHGVGLRYHETIPQLGPDNPKLFEQGMVTSVEPGVYLPGFGGIRIEDNLAVGSDGPVWLSNPCQPW